MESNLYLNDIDIIIILLWREIMAYKPQYYLGNTTHDKNKRKIASGDMSDGSEEDLNVELGHTVGYNINPKGVPFFDELLRGVCESLAESKGGSPIQLAKATGISPKIIVGKIRELDGFGLIKKDDNEIKEFGEEWAFYALTSEGQRLCNDIKHLR